MGFSLKHIFHKKENAAVFIEPGGIGDYYFNIPFFKYIRQSEKFKNLKLILIAKDNQIDFVKSNCGEYFDEIISCNYTDYLESKDYKKYLLKKIHKYNVQILVNLRMIIVDTMGDFRPRRHLVKDVKATVKIADVIKLKENKKFEKKFYKNYNQFIFTGNVGIKFELERKQYFFEQLLGVKIDDVRFENKIEKFIKSDKKNIAISMEALLDNRMASTDTWGKILKYILSSKTEINIIFIGSSDIKQQVKKVILEYGDEHCIDITGKTSVSMLPFILSKCDLLLSVETGTVHVAHSVGCKTICISNGSFYKRFHPYADDIVKYIYSPKFIEKYQQSDDQFKYEAWCGGQKWDLDSVNIEDIISEINKIVGGSNGR